MDFHQTWCVLDIVEICLGLLMGTFHQCLTELSAHDTSIFSIQMITWVNINGFSPNLVCVLLLRISHLG